MGCCAGKIGDLNSFEKAISISQSSIESKEFIEVSLDSYGEVPVEEWNRYKNCQPTFLNDSISQDSTLLQSERRSSLYSKTGSIFDSFTVNFSIAPATNNK